MKNLTAAQPAAHTPRLARIAICLSFLIFALPASAAQQSLASNGRIAFGDSSTPVVWSVRPDGSDLRVLTALPSSGDYVALIVGVSFSADGSRLAVLYEQFGTNTRCGAAFTACLSIVMMNGDGTNHHFIYSSESIASGLALSPDGSRVAFTRVVDRNVPGRTKEPLFLINSDGTHLTRLTLPPNFMVDVGATWAPDGRRIAFFSDRDQGGMITWSLYIVDVNSHAITKVFRSGGGNDLEPDWSPDGQKLVFIRTFEYPDYRVYTVRTNGNDLRLIRGDSSAAAGPHWSPNGSRIAYTRHAGPIADLVAVNASNGFDLRFVASGGTLAFDWRPNY